MTIVFQRPLSRTLVAAGLAIVGTIATFATTASPVQAKSAGYTAKLSASLEAPARKVVNGVVWNCEGDQCSGPVDGAAPVNTCASVVRTFGQVASFATPKGELSADKLTRCNAAA